MDAKKKKDKRKERTRCSSGVAVGLIIRILQASRGQRSRSLPHLYAFQIPLNPFYFLRGGTKNIFLSDVEVAWHRKVASAALKSIVNIIDEWCLRLLEAELAGQEASSVSGQLLDSGTRNGCERRRRERPYRLLAAPVQLLTGGRRSKGHEIQVH